MKINKDIIAKLNPCKNRFDNYLEYYSDFDGDLREFLELENITYDDKVWVFERNTTKEQRMKWAALCAKSVLHLFEERYPNDKRPRNAIEATLNNNITSEIKRNAADAAFATAYAADAYAAAYAADAAFAAAYAADADAAAYAADAAAYAADAAAYATYAAAAYAADAAADAAAADTARQKQQCYNLSMMLEVL